MSMWLHPFRLSVATPGAAPKATSSTITWRSTCETDPHATSVATLTSDIVQHNNPHTATTTVTRTNNNEHTKNTANHAAPATITPTTAQSMTTSSDNRQQLVRGTIHMLMIIVMLHAAARGTIQLAMVNVIQQLLVVMMILMLNRSRSWADSNRGRYRDSQAWPLVGCFSFR